MPAEGVVRVGDRLERGLFVVGRDDDRARFFSRGGRAWRCAWCCCRGGSGSSGRWNRGRWSRGGRRGFGLGGGAGGSFGAGEVGHENQAQGCAERDGDSYGCLVSLGRELTKPLRRALTQPGLSSFCF